MAEYLDRDALCDALSENVRHMSPVPVAFWTGYASAASFVGHFPVATDVAPGAAWAGLVRCYEKRLYPFCPNCGQEQEPGARNNYCTNCGAKMYGADDDAAD